MINLSILNETKNRFSLITTEESRMVDKVNDSLMWGAKDYFRKNGFVWVEVPTLTKITGACENVDTLYNLNHFGQEAYLAQTGQLYLEAKIPLHKKVWTVITSSRAEACADSRHLNQFQLVEIEHEGNLEDLLKNMESTVKSMISEAVQINGYLLKELGRYDELEKWVSEPFNCISYSEGVDMLKGTENQIKWGEDLKSRQEFYLVETLGNKPLFVTHFPKEIKFFNMRQNDFDEKVVNSCDLVMPYSGESAGAAERENNHERLVKRLVESNMFKILSKRGKTIDDFDDYLNLIKKYPVLHSGCGIGFNRMTQSVLAMEDIRGTVSFPLQREVLY